MQGQVLDFSVQGNSGVISGADGARYVFVGSEWKGDVPPARGMRVDFDVQGNNAVAIYRALGAPAINQSTTQGSAKDKTAAGLLALFLGGLGIHKFYLGYTGPALVFLLTNTIGWFVTWMFFGIPNIALGVIALIEGIIYLTKSDEEFQQLYVAGRRPWF